MDGWWVRLNILQLLLLSCLRTCGALGHLRGRWMELIFTKRRWISRLVAWRWQKKFSDLSIRYNIKYLKADLLMIILITHITPTATALCFGVHLGNLHSWKLTFWLQIWVFETIIDGWQRSSPVSGKGLWTCGPDERLTSLYFKF